MKCVNKKIAGVGTRLICTLQETYCTGRQEGLLESRVKLHKGAEKEKASGSRHYDVQELRHYFPNMFLIPL